MGSIHNGSRASSIIFYCSMILGSARNSINTTSSSSTSLVEVGFSNASTFALLDHRITSIEVMGNVSINPLAFSK